MPELHELPRYREDLEGSPSSTPAAASRSRRRCRAPSRIGKIFGILRWQGFFRDASGPGWVLVGDAGHFKDPAAGQGIGDAFRQGEELVPAILHGLNGSDQDLDRALRSGDAGATRMRSGTTGWRPTSAAPANRPPRFPRSASGCARGANWRR